MSSTIKNSTYNSKNGRYVLGGVTEVSNFSIEWWNLKPLVADPSDLLYVIEKKYEGRLDYLGLLFYGDPGLWWIIGQYNGILDPLNELVEGKLIRVPLKDRVEADLFSQNVRAGGIPTTRT